MNIKKLKLLSILVVVFGFLWSTVFGAGIPDKNNRQKDLSLMKPTGTPLYQILNINNITTWMRSDGQQNHSPTSDNGSLYPRGTKWVIYQDGFVWGGKAYLDAGLTTPAPAQLIRVGGQTYNIGTRAGRIIGTGANAVAQSPADPDVRIYRVRRDYAQMDIQELLRDAGESFEIPVSSVTKSQTDQIFNQYAKDWDEWPVTYGAPYIERNGIAGYQKPKPFNYDVTKGALFTTDSLIAGNYDEPGLAGADPNSPADQVVWTVINDLDRSATNGLFGSEPLGLEAQITLWGYKRTDAMGNLYFKKIKFINKGGVDIGGGAKGSFFIDSMYFAQWSDPDLGSYGDDLCGVDMNLFPPVTGSPLSLGYVYNGNAIDAEFKKFGLQPPAVGYDFLQGPLVPGLPTDSGVFNLKRVYGKKNLPMTSFAYFSAGSGISDPPFNYEGGLRWWRMLQGYVPHASTAPWKLYPHPPGVTETKFPLNGDPVTRTGFVDGLGTDYSLASGDRRIVLNTGPFSLAPGDTQEVVVGTVAGLGADRLSSINVMKFYDQFVQSTYDALFQVTPAPAAPAVKIAELDGEITLEWGSDTSAVKKTENTISQPGAFIFEGYNVYQLPSRSASLSQAKRLATFDLLTQPTVILDRQFDKKSGEILMLPVQFGTNSGITRHYQFTRDHILDIDKLNNGQEYYLAITAYSRTTVDGFLPAALESSPNILTVIPQSPQGVRYNTFYGDTINPVHTIGIADNKFEVKVIDPSVITGDKYEVRTMTGDSVIVNFINANRDTIILKFPAIDWELYNITKGKVTIPQNSNFSIDASNVIVDGFKFGFNASPYWVQGQEISSQTYKPEANFNWAPVNWGGKFFGGGLDLGYWFFGGLNPWEVNHTVEVRFNSTQTQKAYVYQRTTGTAASAYTGFYEQPFTVWDVTNPASPRQIDFTILEAFGSATSNNIWAPGAAAAAREYFAFVDEDYTATEKSAYIGKTYGTRHGELPITYSGWYILKDNTKPAYKDGDVWRITATKTLTKDDRWVFDTQSRKLVASAEYDKIDAQKVGVYPNPYYAFNPAETNRFVRFVTFNKLPAKATIRIFNLAGQLVRTLKKEDPTQFLRWDLNNENNFPVASGIYVAHVDMPDVGVTKILKVAIIQEQEVPDVF